MSEVTNKGGALRKVGRATAWVGKKMGLDRHR